MKYGHKLQFSLKKCLKTPKNDKNGAKKVKIYAFFLLAELISYPIFDQPYSPPKILPKYLPLVT